jgi:hypothetical protein
MTPRSLFKIILKIFGLFFIKEIIATLLQLVSAIVYNVDAGRIVEGVFMFAINVIIIFIYGFIVFQLLFNTNNILDKFKLDQGFDEEELSFEKESQKEQFSIGISASSVLTIALLVTAGVILVNEIPNLCKQLFLYLLDSRSIENNDFSFIIISIVKILLALLLIGERKLIVEFVGGNVDKAKKVDND